MIWLNKLINLYKQYEEVIKYLVIGGLTTVISLVTYYLLTFSLFNPNIQLELQIANVISWVVSVLFAYVTNRKIVFSSTNKNIFKEGICFFGSRIITLLMDMLIMFVGVFLLKGNDKIIKIISQIMVIVSNYVLSKLFVFNK